MTPSDSAQHASQSVDLEAAIDACASEPIHIPGGIQPHGCLLGFDKALRLVQASTNAAGSFLPEDLGASLGRPFEQVYRGSNGERIRRRLSTLDRASPVQLGPVADAHGQPYQALAHCAPSGEILLELEQAVENERDYRWDSLENLYPLIRDAFDRIGQAETTSELAAAAAAEIRRITGFDRVLIYRFEENWDGIVVGESRTERLPSLFDLRFPAGDIPAQARQLYTLNRLRMIPDVDYEPIPLVAGEEAAEPLDLSYSVLRSVSPVHRVYMRNMGTPASMSISLLYKGKLWGLAACHHSMPLRLPFATRAACDLMGQMLSMRVAAEEEAADAVEGNRLKQIEQRLLTRMASAENFAMGLLQKPRDLMALTKADGVALLHEGHCALSGHTPDEAAVRALAEWLEERGTEAFDTHSLASVFPPAANYATEASGILAISISKLHPSFVIWFRRELVETVTWAGLPQKSADPQSVDPLGRLNPRSSFAQWQETVRQRAAPWHEPERAAARDLRQAIIGVVLRRAEERAALTDELERINQELAAFSYSVSHDLRAPFRHIAGFAELLLDHENERLTEKGRRFAETIVESAHHAGQLVDALLEFSRMGRTALTYMSVDMNRLVEEVRTALAPELESRDIRWVVGSLPRVYGDPVMLRQVLYNLLSNAVKYSRERDEAVIEVGAEIGKDDIVFQIRDNGAGFDMAYAQKLFGVFQRLHRAEDYEGIGIGLANVRRIIERHGGETWAEGELDKGATFYFSLPRNDRDPARKP